MSLSVSPVGSPGPGHLGGRRVPRAAAGAAAAGPPGVARGRRRPHRRSLALAIPVVLPPADAAHARHLVVVIGKGSRQHLPRLPFHTTSLEWDIDTSKPAEAIYREITPRIRELMEQLRGEKAN